MLQIRKLATWREEIHEELGTRPDRPVVRAVALAAIRNPFAGIPAVEDLTPLWEAGAALGERLMPGLVALLPGPVVSYGKAAIVGTGGEVEHGGACVHPRTASASRSLSTTAPSAGGLAQRWRLRAPCGRPTSACS